MAPNESNLFNLELVTKRDLSKQGTDILNAFSRGMQPATPETAAEAARRLDGLCPPLEQEQAAYDYLWMLWEIMLDVVRSPDATSEIHERFVAVLEDLRQCAKGTLDVWGVSATSSRHTVFISKAR